MDSGSDMEYKLDGAPQDIALPVHIPASDGPSSKATRVDADGYAEVGSDRMPCHRWLWHKHKAKVLVVIFAVTLTAILLAMHFEARRAQDQPVARNGTYTIIVSVDGLRSDFVDRYATPNMHSIITRGVRAKTMQPVFPSLTFPNHYSIVTGQRSPVVFLLLLRLCSSAAVLP
jgi:hypothetical protein